MIRHLKEPLVHFLLIGAALFAASALLSRSDDRPEDDAIVVSAGKIEHLAALFGRTWQRPPTREELAGLVDDFVREEAAYREGLMLGLDRDDTIIRRRLRQKLDFIAEDLASQIEPKDADLATWLAEHPDDFSVDPRLSFRHVYLDVDRRGADLEGDARDLLIALNGDASLDAAPLGDRLLLEHGYADVTPRDISRLFGTGFGESLAALETGTWHGPITSGYGAHLVRIDERVAGRAPELDEVRAAVRREWENERRTAIIEAYYAALLDRYQVTIEWSDVSGEAAP